MRAGAVRLVLVVHDMGCGDCDRIAGALPGLLRVPVRLRSCRDPELALTHPGLPGVTRACGAPAVGTVGPDGGVRWRVGLRAAPALFGLLRPRAVPRGVAVFATAVGATVRRTWRNRPEDR